MADVKIYGMEQSTYVRTVRMTCEEKGVSYELEPFLPHSPEILEQSPTGKVPAFAHADVHLHETLAITRYVDARFDGPALQPSDIRAQAMMNQTVSELSDSFYTTSIREIVLPRFGMAEAAEDTIVQAGTRLDTQFARLDDQLKDSECLVGNDVTLADLYLAPLAFWLEKTPEGQRAMGNKQHFGRWYDRMQQRASFTRTSPPMPG